MDKTCSKCGETKPESAFYKRAGTDKPTQPCKDCKAKATSERRAGDPDARARQRAATARWREAHPESSRQSSAESHRRNAGRVTKFPAEKVCPGCDQTKPIDDFGKCARTRDGHQARCRKCQSKTAMAWNKANPERFSRNRRNSRLRTEYGIGPEGYEALMESQGGVCAICGRPPAPRKPLHVDHCHDSGRVRGLLCRSCNQALGLFEDQPEWLRRAADYLST